VLTLKPTLKSLGFKIGKITFVDYIGENELREMYHKGKRIQPGDQLEKTSTIDLVLGNGKGSYRSSQSDDNDSQNNDTDGGN